MFDDVLQGFENTNATPDGVEVDAEGFVIRNDVSSV